MEERVLTRDEKVDYAGKGKNDKNSPGEPEMLEVELGEVAGN